MTAALTAVSVLPVTGLWAATAILPYPVSNPYSKVTVVAELPAFTVPFRVAEIVPMAVAALVVAVGAVPTVPMVKVISRP